MRLPWRPPEQISVPRSLWSRLLTEVASRGEGHRESGAFLLAPSRRTTVSAFVLYDDLDPHCLVGTINFSGRGFSALWDLCEETDTLPVADLHTHPGTGVRQSHTDASHPMISVPGHVALIAPDFLQRRVPRSEFGIHVYNGQAGWSSHFGSAARRRVRLVRG